MRIALKPEFLTDSAVKLSTRVRDRFHALGNVTTFHAYTTVITLLGGRASSEPDLRAGWAIQLPAGSYGRQRRLRRRPERSSELVAEATLRILTLLRMGRRGHAGRRMWWRQHGH